MGLRSNLRRLRRRGAGVGDVMVGTAGASGLTAVYVATSG